MAEKSRSLLSQIGTYGSWLILSKSIGFLLLPLYTHYLTPMDYGVLAVLDLISTYFGIVVTAGFSSALMRYYNQHNNLRWQKMVYSSSMIAVLMVGLLFMSLSLIMIPMVSMLSGAEHITSDLVIIILLTTFLNAISGISFTLLRVQEKISKFVVLNAINLGVSVLLNIVLIAGLGYGVYGFVFSGLVSGLLTTILCMVLIWKPFYHRPHKTLIIRLSKYSYPFIFSGFLNAFIHNIAIICLTISNDLSQTGIYAVGQKIGSIVSVLGSSIVMAWTPHMFKVAKEKSAPEAYARGALIIVTLMLCTTLGLTVLAEPIIELMTESSYHQASIVILPIGIGLSLFNLSPTLRMGINLNNQTRKIPLITLLAILIGFPLCLWLTSLYGMYGAAWGLAATWTINSGLTIWLSHRYMSVPYDLKSLTIVFSSFALSVLFYFKFKDSFYISVIALLIFPVCLFFSGIFKTELKQLLVLMRKNRHL